MGYYDNPPIINIYGDPNKAVEGITSFGKSIGDAFTDIAKNRLLQAKEAQASLEKQRDKKNSSMLAYNDKMEDWQRKQKPGSPLMAEAKKLIKSENTSAADARIALTMETDPDKRDMLYDISSKPEATMAIMGELSENLGGEIATWLTLTPSQVNTVGGYGINASDEQLEPRTEFANVLSGMVSDYKDHQVSVVKENDALFVKANATRNDGSKFEYKLNATEYNNSIRSGTGGLLQKIESVDDYTSKALKGIKDEKGKDIIPLFFEEKDGSAKLAMGTDRQRSIYGQKLKKVDVMNKIMEQSQITATGYLKAGGTASLRALLNSTLKQGTKFYDANFKNQSLKKQTEILTNALAEDTFAALTSDMEYSYEKGEKVYWGGPRLKVFEEKNEKPNESNDNDNNEGDNKDKDKKESIESISRRIYDTKLGDIADFTYNGRKVSYDGDSFIVERTTGLKDLAFNTKPEVINYLKTGSTNKPRP